MDHICGDSLPTGDQSGGATFPTNDTFFLVNDHPDGDLCWL
jgi:hypothetical protein